jgi:leader peptidase (prepilin peptidase)/N-methyltransferase
MIFLWFVAWRIGMRLPPLLLSVYLLISLISLAWFDFDHYRIPNWISYPLIFAGFGLAYVKGVDGLVWHMLGAAIGYGFIWCLNVYWRRRHGKDGIGMGDAKLLAAAGSWLGPLSLPFITLIASGAALFVILMAKAFGKGAMAVPQRIAFGPYIALGYWSVWLHPVVL